MMTTTEYAQKIAEFIRLRPQNMDMDRLLYEIYVQAKLLEAERDEKAGRWISHDDMMEKMWERINMKSAGSTRPKKIS